MELERLMSAQWPSGMVPHIVFWEDDSDYFPGPAVWATKRSPATTGITQPPLPISAAVQLFETDPDRSRAVSGVRSLWPSMVAWLSWLERARKGPHGACVIVHPWESGMDNSPSWDAPLAAAPEVRDDHIERRDVRTVSAAQRPSQKEYRQYLGIVEKLKAAGWNTERQPEDSPFAVEDPSFTAIAARAAADLAAIASDAGEDGSRVAAMAATFKTGLEAMWDEAESWYRPFDTRRSAFVGPATSVGLVAVWAGVDPERVRAVVRRIDEWTSGLACGVPTTDPGDVSFDPLRYWRGPVWVLINWLVAQGLEKGGYEDHAESLKATTRGLVDRGFSEYYDPRNGDGIGGHGFSWSAALTLDWLT
jgi:hypothetical protein